MKLTLFLLFTLVVFTTPTTIPKRTLGDELKEFRALLPFKKINVLVFRYFANDPEFQELVRYILSDDIRPGIEEVESLPEVQAILKYLYERGSDIYDLLNKLHKILQLEPLPEPHHTEKTETAGLVGFVNELRTLIPVKELRELYDYKLKTSEIFQDFVNFLQSPNFQSGIDKILQNKHVMNLLHFVKSKNVDLKVIADFITGLIGVQFTPTDTLLIEFHTRKSKKLDLNKEVSEFLSLVPTVKVIDCANLYMKSSRDFRLAYLYMSSNLFKTSVKTVSKTVEGKALMEYYKVKGLNVKKSLKMIETQFGVKKYNAKNAASEQSPKTGNMTSFLKDVESLLPVEKIHELFSNKTTTDPQFANYTAAFQSTEVNVLYNNLYSTKESKNLVTEAADFGINFEALAQLAYKVLGLEYIHISF